MGMLCVRMEMIDTVTLGTTLNRAVQRVPILSRILKAGLFAVRLL